MTDGYRLAEEHSPGGPADSASSHFISVLPVELVATAFAAPLATRIGMLKVLHGSYASEGPR